MGPGEAKAVSAECDARAGGRYRWLMRTPSGEEHDVSGVYCEVVPDGKLVFTWAWKTTPERELSVTVLLKEVLVDELSARLVVVGEDFHFGHGRRGNIELLRRLGTGYGFEVVGVGLTGDGREPVSSTRIRALIAQGDVEGAARLLGRPHEVRGPVVRGDGRGGPELGFPTANLAVPDDIALPADAVYAGHYRRADGSVHQAAISVGRRPTFYEPGTAPVLVEAYLLHFEGDLYGEPAAVSFAHRLRDEQRFESIDALVAQMRADVEATERVLASADLP